MTGKQGNGFAAIEMTAEIEVTATIGVIEHGVIGGTGVAVVMLLRYGASEAVAGIEAAGVEVAGVGSPSSFAAPAGIAAASSSAALPLLSAPTRKLLAPAAPVVQSKVHAHSKLLCSVQVEQAVL